MSKLLKTAIYNWQRYSNEIIERPNLKPPNLFQHVTIWPNPTLSVLNILMGFFRFGQVRFELNLISYLIWFDQLEHNNSHFEVQYVEYLETKPNRLSRHLLEKSGEATKYRSRVKLIRRSWEFRMHYLPSVSCDLE